MSISYPQYLRDLSLHKILEMYNNQETFYKKLAIQENIYVEVSFLIKMQTFRPATLMKGDSNTDAFLKILKKNFWE